MTGHPEIKIVSSLFEGLTELNPETLDPRPAASESWDISKDELTYTFHLRKDALWSNGDPVTAGDFLFAYKRMLSPLLTAEYSFMLHVIKHAEGYAKGEVKDFNEVGAKAINDHCLEIQLRAPTPYFTSLISNPSWFPLHKKTILKFGKIDERGTRWTRPGNLVGNGAFKLKSWRIDDVVVVDRNPHYREASKIRLNEIRFYAIDNTNTEERAFRAEQLHTTNTIPVTKVPVYRKSKSPHLHIHPALAIYYYMINTAKPPFDDPRVRKALAMTIDREAIVEKITQGGQLPAYHYTPPSAGGYFARARIGKNIEKAKLLLKESGYPNGEGFPPTEILFNTSESHKAIAEAIQQMWKTSLNVEIKLLNQDWKVYLASRKSKNYQLARAAWFGDYNDANTFLDLFISDSPMNRSNWGSPEYDRLLKLAGNTGDMKARLEYFQKAETILLDELPIIPIYFYVNCYLKQSSVKNWPPNILDYQLYKNIYLESDK